MSASPAVPPRARTALVTGVATALYYATPDVVGSRTTRGWLKAGLTAVTLAASLKDLRGAGAPVVRLDHGDGSPADRGDLRSVPLARTLAGVGGVAALAVTVGATLAAGERWIFRRGEARARAGARLPHTRTALLLGLLAAALTLVPPPTAVAGRGGTATTGRPGPVMR